MELLRPLVKQISQKVGIYKAAPTGVRTGRLLRCDVSDINNKCDKYNLTFYKFWTQITEFSGI